VQKLYKDDLDKLTKKFKPILLSRNDKKVLKGTLTRKNVSTKILADA
jgi:hypothetical protein